MWTIGNPSGICLDDEPLDLEMMPTTESLQPAPETTAFAVSRHHRCYALRAARDVMPGEVILELRGDVFPQPTRSSVQVGAGRHIDAPVRAGLEERMDRYPFLFLNHSCEPNAWVDGIEVLAVRAIREGEEITFDYDTNEFQLATPFRCGCGGEGCRKEIRGYRYLPPRIRQSLRHLVAPHLTRSADLHS